MWHNQGLQTVFDVATAETMPERAGVDTIVGQFVACAVSKHVRVSFESEARVCAGPLYQLGESGRREGPSRLTFSDRHHQLKPAKLLADI